MEVEVRGCLIFLFDVSLRWGREEMNPDQGEDPLLRLLVPLLKLYSGKMAIKVTGEAMECFGGTG